MLLRTISRLVVPGVFALVAGPAAAGVAYSTGLNYLTGYDPYHPNSLDDDPTTNFGTAFGVYGATSAPLQLDHVEAGPKGGTFEFAGAAESAPGLLKARAAVAFTEYAAGSYYMVDGPADEPDDLPVSGQALSAFSDDTVITGPDATYDIAFTYRLNGVTDRPSDSTLDSYFRPTVILGAGFAAAGNNYSEGTAVTPADGFLNSEIRLTVPNVPAGVTLSLSQFLRILIYSFDSMYYGPTPCEDGGITLAGEEPLEKPCEEGRVQAPYSVTVSADFSHTLELEDLAILGPDGNVAVGASLTSLNGVYYPGQSVDAPAPGTLALLLAGLGWIGLRRPRSR